MEKEIKSVLERLQNLRDDYARQLESSNYEFVISAKAKIQAYNNAIRIITEETGVE